MSLSKRSHKDTVRDFFGENVHTWFDRYHASDFDSVMYQDRASAALRLLERHAKDDSLILDAGCGAGVQSLLFRASGYRVVACDLAPDMAKRAKRTLEEMPGADGSSVLLTDLERLAVKKGSLDAVVMLGVLGYTDHPDVVLRSVRAALKTNGLFIASTLSRTFLLARISDVVSFVPNRLYRWLKQLMTGRPLAVPQYGSDFYDRNLTYIRAREFDAYIERNGFRKRSGASTEFGQAHFMGKRIHSDKLDIFLCRLVAKIARLPLLGFLDDHARQYVACYEKQDVMES